MAMDIFSMNEDDFECNENREYSKNYKKNNQNVFDGLVGKIDFNRRN